METKNRNRTPRKHYGTGPRSAPYGKARRDDKGSANINRRVLGQIRQQVVLWRVEVIQSLAKNTAVPAAIKDIHFDLASNAVVEYNRIEEAFQEYCATTDLSPKPIERLGYLRYDLLVIMDKLRDKEISPTVLTAITKALSILPTRDTGYDSIELQYRVCIAGILKDELEVARKSLYDDFEAPARSMSNQVYSIVKLGKTGTLGDRDTAMDFLTKQRAGLNAIVRGKVPMKAYKDVFKLIRWTPQDGADLMEKELALSKLLAELNINVNEPVDMAGLLEGDVVTHPSLVMSENDWLIPLSTYPVRQRREISKLNGQRKEEQGSGHFDKLEKMMREK